MRQVSSGGGTGVCDLCRHLTPDVTTVGHISGAD